MQVALLLLWPALLAPAFCQDPAPVGKVPARGSIQWWQGEWTGEGACPAEKYSILLAPEKDSVRFEMKAYSGAHTGGMEGLAKWETNRLVFTSMNEDSDPPAPVKVTFHQAGEKIRVFTTNTETYGGMGIEFHDRWYDRGPPKPKKDPLASLGLITPHEEEHLRKISGKDYDTIVYSMHLTRIHDEKYPDFKGKVVDGFVRGLAPWGNVILLVQEDGKMAAVFTDAEKKELRYVSEFGDLSSLPSAVQQWLKQSAVNGYPVKRVGFP
jgi:hypothetical protein